MLCVCVSGIKLTELIIAEAPRRVTHTHKHTQGVGSVWAPPRLDTDSASMQRAPCVRAAPSCRHLHPHASPWTVTMQPGSGTGSLLGDIMMLGLTLTIMHLLKWLQLGCSHLHPRAPPGPGFGFWAIMHLRLGGPCVEPHAPVV